MAFQLTITSGRGQGKDFFFTKERVRIGRLPDNDLVLYDTGVSRHHCEIVREGAAFSLRDIGSANGTLLNDVLTTEARVADGDRIGVGPITFVFQHAEDPASSRGLGARQSLSRPESFTERRHLEELHTRAIRAEDLEMHGTQRPTDRDSAPQEPSGVKRTETGSFVAYRRKLQDRFLALPRSTRLAIISGSAVLILAIAISLSLIVSQPLPDRSGEVFPVSAEVAATSFGAGRVGVNTPDRANFRFDYRGGRVTLSYAAGSIDSANEVEILVNGKHVDYVAVTRGWTKGLMTKVPRDVLTPGANVITFDNTYTPLRAERWGISQLKVDQDELPSPDPAKAKELFTLGQASYDTRSVAPQNLYRSLEYFEQAQLLLEALDEKPPLHAEILRSLGQSRQELQSIHNSHVFTAQKALRFGNRAQAVETLRSLLRYYPDPEDRRHKEVKKRLSRIPGKRP